MSVPLRRAPIAAVVFAGLSPPAALACACGCGVFDVGTVSMLPSHPGGAVYLEDDYMNESQNRVGAHAAPAAASPDKEIQTHFGTLGADFQFNGDWGASIGLPVLDRLLRTDTGAPELTDIRHSALGDLRLIGRYTGLAPDLSTGLQLGVKLPTGDWTYRSLDRDTSIGTGTTDLLLGAYHIGTLSVTGSLQWFAEALYDRAFHARAGYRPGNELDIAAGTLYSGLRLGSVSVVPLLQVLGSTRLRDSGANADPANSGYRRLLISPGAEVASGRWKLYADLEYPLYQYANAASSVQTEGAQGQLAAPVLFKAMLSYHW